MATPIERVLDLARWAPSGDNTQPWRFEILGPLRCVIHGLDTRERVIYDFRGFPSHMAHGALVETAAIAASTLGMAARIGRRPGTPENHLLFDFELERDASITPHPLVPAITARVTQRRPMRTDPLTVEDKRGLEQAAGEGYEVLWFEGRAARMRVARLLYRSAWIRLRCPEAYPVHREIIEWGARFSEDRIPDQALGAGPVTLKLMRAALASWGRVEFLNTWLGGTLAPRLQMDLLPGLLCGAHFLIAAARPPESADDFVEGGRAMQRLWLTAAARGLFVQPEMTPLIFSAYVRRGERFTRAERVWEAERGVSGRFAALVGPAAAGRSLFLGRIGRGPAPRARSVRLPLERLLAPPGRVNGP